MPLSRIQRMVFLSVSIALMVLMHGPVYAVDPGEERYIDALIGEVENMKEGAFIRNGISYDAKKAASHLRDKYDYFKKDIHTADDFIRLCATRSEMTGLHYKLKEVPSAPAQDAAEWMYTHLARLRDDQHAQAQAQIPLMH